MCSRDQNEDFHTGKMRKRRRERGIEALRKRVDMDTHVGQVPGQGGLGSLRVQAGGQGERQEEGEGKWSQREGRAVSDLGPEGSLVKRGQVRWRAVAPGAGSSWTRGAPGRVRQEAEGPERLGCGPKRDEGGQ